MPHPTRLAAAALLAASSAALADVPPLSFDVLAVEGAPAPGGGTFQTLSFPVGQPGGAVAFTGRLTGLTPAAFLADPGGGARRVATAGDALSGGSAIDRFGNVYPDNLGGLVGIVDTSAGSDVLARFSPGVGGGFASDVLVREGQAVVPGGLPLTDSGLIRPAVAVSGRGDVAATVFLENPGGLPGAGTVYAFSPDGTVRQAVEPGESVPGGGGTIFSAGPSALASDGTLAFTFNATGGIEGYGVVAPDGTRDLPGRTGSPVADSGGLILGSEVGSGSNLSGGIDVNAAGQVALIADLTTGDGTPVGRSLLGPTPGGDLGLLARQGTPLKAVPGSIFADVIDNERFFPLVTEPRIDPAGRVAFAGRLAVGPGGVTGDDDAGLFVSDPMTGDVALAVREGQALPGDANRVFDSLTSGNFVGDDLFAFPATVRAAGSGQGSAFTAGLFVYDAADGTTTSLLAAGDVIEVGPGDLRTVANVLTGDRRGPLDAGGAFGSVAAEVAFTDGSTAIVRVVAVPEPTTAALLAAGAVLLLRRRR